MKADLRKIRKEDDASLAQIILEVMEEYTIDQEGTIATDPFVYSLSTCYQHRRSRYYTAWIGDTLLGGCGIHPLQGGKEDTAELQRMFLTKAYQKKGIGSQLLEACLQFARSQQYTYCYLETLSGMQSAISLYRKFGFVDLPHRWGNTGHFGCNRFMRVRL